MAPTVHDAAQRELLAWSPPAAVERFAPERVRAATLAGKVKRGVAEALRHSTEAGRDREAIAAAMADYLGEEVAKSSLDAWSSEARESQVPSLVRFVALLKATQDPRLLQVLAQECGWVVVDRKWLPLIELASLREHEDEVRRRRRALQAEGRNSGALA